jgi:hypothetical protein
MERDKSVQERDKAKTKYDTSCEEVETGKQKQERAFDEKNQEKLKKSYFQDILDMNNNKVRCGYAGSLGIVMSSSLLT